MGTYRDDEFTMWIKEILQTILPEEWITDSLISDYKQKYRKFYDEGHSSLVIARYEFYCAMANKGYEEFNICI